ncbi:hypothetical protein K502DRAFT_345101 [Neoconidiobolus thromboides FSU 785]|nr:hypothetical protein K502DRAFT_345101 [Neoconidiobolus thromboides FSU 785]
MSENPNNSISRDGSNPITPEIHFFTQFPVSRPVEKVGKFIGVQELLEINQVAEGFKPTGNEKKEITQKPTLFDSEEVLTNYFESKKKSSAGIKLSHQFHQPEELENELVELIKQDEVKKKIAAAGLKSSKPIPIWARNHALNTLEAEKQQTNMTEKSKESSFSLINEKDLRVQKKVEEVKANNNKIESIYGIIKKKRNIDQVDRDEMNDNKENEMELREFMQLKQQFICVTEIKDIDIEQLINYINQLATIRYCELFNDRNQLIIILEDSNKAYQLLEFHKELTLENGKKVKIQECEDKIIQNFIQNYSKKIVEPKDNENKVVKMSDLNVRKVLRSDRFVHLIGYERL